MAVTVCHLAPGTSEWSWIAHRFFSHISVNWRTRPLVSHEAAGQLIQAARTWAGLTVTTTLDKRRSPTDLKMLAEEMASVNLESHGCHGE